MRSSSCPDGRCTLRNTSPLPSSTSGDGATFAPTPRYSASTKPEARPAPAWTKTSIPAATIFSTVAGTAATLLSPAAVSLRTATFMPLPAADVDLQLVDQPLLLVQHEADHVAHGDDADIFALVGDEQMAGEVHAHQVGALRLGRAGRDAGEIAAHRRLDGAVAAAPFRQHVVGEVSLGHQPHDLTALL